MAETSRVDKMFSTFLKGTSPEEGGESTPASSTASSTSSAAAKEQKSKSAPGKKGGKGKEEKDYARATIYLRKDQHKHLKRMAVDNETEISALVREAVDKVFPIPDDDE